jgi:hypothetical protein
MSCFLLLLPCMIFSLLQGRIYPVNFIITTTADTPILVAARSKAWVCGTSLVGIVVSNPAVCPLVSVVCFQVENSARVDHSSRRVLPIMVCMNVNVNLYNVQTLTR